MIQQELPARCRGSSAVCVYRLRKKDRDTSGSFSLRAMHCRWHGEVHFHCHRRSIGRLRSDRREQTRMRLRCRIGMLPDPW